MLASPLGLSHVARLDSKQHSLCVTRSNSRRVSLSGRTAVLVEVERVSM